MQSFVRGCALLLVVAAAGCSAQNPAPASPAAAGSEVDAALKRKIELQIRHRFANLPPSVAFEVRDRRPSDIPGWDSVAVDLITQRGNRQAITLYVSKDNKQLAHIERFNLDNIPGSNINIEGRPVRGNPNAKVSVISFDDFACPYCAVMHQKLFPTILNEYGDKVKFIYKDFPLESIHPWAMRAALNANCLGEQKNDAYWEYSDWVHAKQQAINKTEKGERRTQVEQVTQLDNAARDVGRKHGVDAERLNACIKKQDESAVRASMKEAAALNVDGTPTIFINGERLGGDTELDNIRAVLDRALIAAGEQPPARPQPTATQPVKK